MKELTRNQKDVKRRYVQDEHSRASRKNKRLMTATSWRLIADDKRKGDPKGWSMVLITALGSWEKPVHRGHMMRDRQWKYIWSFAVSGLSTAMEAVCNMWSVFAPNSLPVLK